MKKITSVLMAVIILAASLLCVSCGEEKKAITIKSLDDLNGLSVAFQTGTTADGLIEELNKTGAIKTNNYSNEEMAACFTLLQNGEIDAVMCDSGVAELFVKNNPGKFSIAWTQTSEAEEFGIAIGKGDTKMKTAIDLAMAELKADGFMDALYDKWFGSGSEVTMPTGKSETISAEVNVLNAGYLTVGSEIGYPPFEDYAEDGKTAIGYDMDLVKAIAIKLGLDVKVIDTAFDTILAGIGTNYDIVAAAVTIDADRAKQVDFSDPYIVNYQTVVIAK